MSTYSIDVGFPVFACRFKDKKTVVIGGGGGEGKNGIKNKISALTIEKDQLILGNEIEFAENEDNVTSLEVVGNTVYAGVNRDFNSIKQGKNDHLRVINLKEKKVKKSHSFILGEHYQKCTSASNNLLAISPDEKPAKLIVISLKSMKQKYTKEYQSKNEIEDVSFSPSGDQLLVVLDEKLIILDASTGEEQTTIDRNDESHKFTKARFINENDIVAAANTTSRTGAFLMLFNQGTLTKTHRVSDVKGFTAMAVSKMYIAVASADFNVLIFSPSLSKLKKYKQVHHFSITDMAISPNSRSLVSTSAANTVNLIVLPADGEFHSFPELWIQAFISILVLLIVAVGFEFIVRRQVLVSLPHLTRSKGVTND